MVGRWAFDPNDDNIFHTVWGGELIGKTRRTLRNKQYSAAGLQAIKGDDSLNERYRWFAGEGKNHRQAVLVELGRVALQFGDARAMAMADELVDLVDKGEVSTTREAAACLRRARLSLIGKPPAASAEALERLITTAINGYLSEHPEATMEMVQEALLGVYGSVEKMAD